MINRLISYLPGDEVVVEGEECEPVEEEVVVDELAKVGVIFSSKQ